VKRLLVVRGLVSLCAALLLCAAACASNPGTAVNDGATPVRTLRADGLTLEAACVTTGVERCFDAIDDNCNGLIDEGCGIASGSFQAILAWSSAAADVDLALVIPSGARIGQSNRAREGFKLDRNCPLDACVGQNFESIVYDGVEPPKGVYVVEVRLGTLGGGNLPIRGHLGLRVGGRTLGASVELTSTDDRKTLMFEM
jgi:hypothetical protein